MSFNTPYIQFKLLYGIKYSHLSRLPHQFPSLLHTAVSRHPVRNETAAFTGLVPVSMAPAMPPIPVISVHRAAVFYINIYPSVSDDQPLHEPFQMRPPYGIIIFFSRTVFLVRYTYMYQPVAHPATECVGRDTKHRGYFFRCKSFHLFYVFFHLNPSLQISVRSYLTMLYM